MVRSNPLTLYRGCGPAASTNIAWTPDAKTADFRPVRWTVRGRVRTAPSGASSWRTTTSAPERTRYEECVLDPAYLDDDTVELFDTL
jgi:hypothetical protein